MEGEVLNIMYAKERNIILGSFANIKKGLSKIFINEQINMTEFFALNGIINKEDIREVSKNLKINKSAISQMLSNLEKKGLITRSINKDDRRRLDIEITPNGNDIINRVNDIHEVIITSTFNKLGVDKTKQLAALLNEFSEDLKDSTAEYINSQEGN